MPDAQQYGFICPKPKKFRRKDKATGVFLQVGKEHHGCHEML